MDNQKDNSKGHDRNVSLDIKNTMLFNGDDYSLFVYKKTEKLTAALYMVTSLFNESEPLRHHLREAGLCLLSHSITFAASNVQDRQYVEMRLSETVFEILSFLTIAFYGGHVSEMNFTILKSEFNSLIQTIEKKEQSEKKKNGFILSESFFDTEEKYSGLAHIEDVPGGNGLKGHKQNGQQWVAKGRADAVSPALNTQQGKPLLKDISERKESRKTIIVNLLKKGGDLTVKDFSRVIPDCSEKTIQRELLQLVQDGVLKKQGERRWSKYSLLK